MFTQWKPTPPPQPKTLSYRTRFSSGDVIECGGDHRRATAYVAALKQRHIQHDAPHGKWWGVAEEVFTRADGKECAITFKSVAGLDADLSNPLLSSAVRVLS